MRPVHRLNVAARLPERLNRLREVAHNLRWTWDSDSIELFRRLDSKLWETTQHNPVAMLGLISQDRLQDAVDDPGFLAHFDRICESLDEYISSKSTWYHRAFHLEGDWCIGYFSMEFGVTECLPIYSGGLGVLAGDHMKSASDLGLPLVGVGLLYKRGYFRQYLNQDGWQQELYSDNDFYNMPVALIRDAQDKPVTVQVELMGRKVILQLWQMQLGRIKVLFLDSNVPENDTRDQDLTDVLYGGDAEVRISQEIILGIGGIRALRALGYDPKVCHCNEGHSAFLALERIRLMMQEKKVSFAVAREAVRAGTIFTTHTSVPAGIDRFPTDLMEKYFGNYRSELGLSKDEFLALGRENPHNHSEPFCMAVLAIKLSGYCNGVSKLHGKVSRRMWQNVWPGIPEDEIGIISVTNGIHYHSWTSPEMSQLYDRYLGLKWAEDPSDNDIWEQVDQIPPGELWRTHERRRERLVAYARRRLRAQLEARGGTRSEIEAADEVLDPGALTIGFARRFATYKRATLILQDSERLARLLNLPGKPVQIIFAGKAHPKDTAGKELICTIIRMANKPDFRKRVVFLEDYDMAVSRYMVQGCDIWLNNPRRLEEASGTSGMKAMANGALNVSILDGWWDEAYRPGLGWIVGQGEVYEQHDYQNEVEARALYKLFENEVIPTFYDRGQDGLPRRWIQMMKSSISVLSPQFNSNRMVHEYANRCYLPAAERMARFSQGDVPVARALAEWKVRVERAWPNVRILKSQVDSPSEPRVGEVVKVRAWVELGGLNPDDVAVEIYAGALDGSRLITGGQSAPMQWAREVSEGSVYVFTGDIECNRSGQYGITVRVRPSHQELSHPFELRLIRWAEPTTNDTKKPRTE